MSNQEYWIPLFPLEIVLFPGSKIPLHIFEDRYKVLIGQCIETGEGFGINLVNGSLLNSIGCTAHIISVTKEYEDGRLDIVVEGDKRYTLLEQDKVKSAYLWGRVAFLPNNNEPSDHNLRKQVIGLYNEVMSKVYEGKFRLAVEETSPINLSFKLAQKAGLPAEERQTLLEMNSEIKRIQYLIKYFTDIIPKLDKSREIQRIVQNDGYILE